MKKQIHRALLLLLFSFLTACQCYGHTHGHGNYLARSTYTYTTGDPVLNAGYYGNFYPQVVVNASEGASNY